MPKFVSFDTASDNLPSARSIKLVSDTPPIGSVVIEQSTEGTLYSDLSLVGGREIRSSGLTAHQGNTLRRLR
jgi:hypothetical protein